MIKCKKCGTIMWRAPVVLTSYPPQYRYHCPKCNHIEYSKVYDNEYVIENYKQWEKLQQKEG